MHPLDKFAILEILRAHNLADDVMGRADNFIYNTPNHPSVAISLFSDISLNNLLAVVFSAVPEGPARRTGASVIGWVNDILFKQGKIHRFRFNDADTEMYCNILAFKTSPTGNYSVLVGVAGINTDQLIVNAFNNVADECELINEHNKINDSINATLELAEQMADIINNGNSKTKLEADATGAEKLAFLQGDKNPTVINEAGVTISPVYAYPVDHEELYDPYLSEDDIIYATGDDSDYHLTPLDDLKHNLFLMEESKSQIVAINLKSMDSEVLPTLLVLNDDEYALLLSQCSTKHEANVRYNQAGFFVFEENSGEVFSLMHPYQPHEVATGLPITYPLLPLKQVSGFVNPVKPKIKECCLIKLSNFRLAIHAGTGGNIHGFDVSNSTIESSSLVKRTNWEFRLNDLTDDDCVMASTSVMMKQYLYISDKNFAYYWLNRNDLPLDYRIEIPYKDATGETRVAKYCFERVSWVINGDLHERVINVIMIDDSNTARSACEMRPFSSSHFADAYAVGLIDGGFNYEAGKHIGTIEENLDKTYETQTLDVYRAAQNTLNDIAYIIDNNTGEKASSTTSKAFHDIAKEFPTEPFKIKETFRLNSRDSYIIEWRTADKGGVLIGMACAMDLDEMAAYISNNGTMQGYFAKESGLLLEGAYGDTKAADIQIAPYGAFDYNMVLAIKEGKLYFAVRVQPKPKTPNQV